MIPPTKTLNARLASLYILFPVKVEEISCVYTTTATQKNAPVIHCKHCNGNICQGLLIEANRKNRTTKVAHEIQITFKFPPHLMIMEDENGKSAIVEIYCTASANPITLFELFKFRKCSVNVPPSTPFAIPSDNNIMKNI